MDLSSPSSSKRIRDSSSDDELEQPNSKRLKNNVFMNYSFDDIGKNFSSHLQESLSRYGFTISNHTKLPVGEDVCSGVLEAIEESEICVVIFSTKYAFSKESLDELVTIMDCHGKLDQRKILPVFLKVEPSDVRSQDGSFKEAFEGHETNIDLTLKRVHKWKETLRVVGQLAGLTLKNDGDEAKFVLKIVKELEKMQSPQEMHVTDHPVGVGSRSEELISTLMLDREDVKVVGVFGTSGIGKTTIVKAMFNKIASKFTASVFLDDIHRRCSGTGDWKFELRKDLFSQQNKNGNVKWRRDDLLPKILNLLKHKKTLLVLDDVHNIEQLEALGINQDVVKQGSAACFCKGSRIIVTTRDKESLGSILHTSYHTRLLDYGESRKLLFLLIPIDEPGRTEFVEEVVPRVRGHPLVLKAWSCLFTHYKDLMPEALKRLNGIPNDDVQKQLQMSCYDPLKPKSQDLFLDIACFFFGMQKDLVAKVLNDEDFYFDFEYKKLAHKFLVENGKSYLSLPHVIKEMGYEVVHQQSHDEPGQRTRLMDRSDVVGVFRDCSGTESIRSIRLEGSWKKLEPETTVQLEAFKRISNLRFLKLGFLNLQWSSSSNDAVSFFSFKHLKYLEWYEFPCKSIDIDMGNVVVIKLQESKLEKLWEGVKSFKKLKILDVSWSKSLTKTGNFGGLENLEELSLTWCENLEELDSSIGCLQKLVDLDLGGCTRLKRFPWETISNLTSLQTLDLSHCPNILEISHEIGSLKSLKSLDLSYNNFHSLPDSICQLHQLTQLILSHCTNLKSIPNLPLNIEGVYAEGCRSLVRLVSLEYLGLNGNTFSSPADRFSNLSKLEHLDLNGCSELLWLPVLPWNLTVKRAYECMSLPLLPKPTLPLFPSADINSINKLIDDEDCFSPIQDEEYLEYYLSPWYLDDFERVLQFMPSECPPSVR